MEWLSYFLIMQLTPTQIFQVYSTLKNKEEKVILFREKEHFSVSV